MPPSETILKNYPDLDYDKLRKMNRKDFEGIITSFDFSYQPDGSIDATVYLTGTSNVYTDVSLYIPTQAEIGDYALYLGKASIEIEIEKKEYLIVPQSAILILIRDDIDKIVS